MDLEFLIFFRHWVFCFAKKKKYRPSVKDLLNDTEFFAEETGLKVEVVSRDEAVASTSESVQFRLRVLDPKKRRDKHKENEAIQFEFNVVTDDADKLAQDMVGFVRLSRAPISPAVF